MSKLAEQKELNENLAYENKKMGDFLELIGLSIDDITDVVIHAEVINMKLCEKIKHKVLIIERNIVKEEIKKLNIKIKEKENGN